MSMFFRSREARGPFPEPVIPRPAAATGSTFASVSLWRAESSLQQVALWSAVDLLASLVSTLPLDVFRGTGQDRTELPKPKLLQDPAGDGYGVEDWLHQYMVSTLLRGNVYGKQTGLDRMGYPTQVVLYHPDEVQGWRDEETGASKWRVAGRDVPAEEMWHQRAYPMPGRLLGLSPIAHHATTIGLGIAASRFGVQWFQDGAHPSGMLTTDSSLNEEQARTAKARFIASMRGTREPAVLGNGWKYQAIQVSAEESQFLQTQGYTAAECARIYGPGIAEVLGYDTGGSLTYTNVEQRSLDLLTYTLNRWLVRVERMFTRMLPNGQYVKLNRAALSSTDLLTRYKAHAIAVQNRWQIINEIRDLEDMPHVAWGDEPPAPEAPTKISVAH